MLVTIWLHVGCHLVAFWLPLVAFWLPLVAFCLPLVAFWSFHNKVAYYVIVCILVVAIGLTFSCYYELILIKPANLGSLPWFPALVHLPANFEMARPARART